VSLFSERKKKFQRNSLVMFSSDLFLDGIRAWLRRGEGYNGIVGGKQ
jgi:hypothetical protein